MTTGSVRKLSNAETWKLGQWLSAKELVPGDSLESLATEASQVLGGAQVTIANGQSMLTMGEKKIPRVLDLSTDARVRMLATAVQEIYRMLGEPAPADVLDLIR